MENSISDRFRTYLKYDYNNPFSDLFQEKRFREDFKDDLSEQEKDALDFVSICSTLHFDGVENVFLLFKQLNFTKGELIEFLFHSTNRHSFELRPKVLDQLNNDKIAYHVEDVNYLKYTREDGSETPMRNLVETIADFLSYSIDLTHKWNDRYLFPKINSDDENENIFISLCNIVNILINLESAYESLLLQNGQIISEDDKKVIRIFSGVKWISMLMSAAEMRTHNNINEFLYPLIAINQKLKPKKTGPISIEVINGNLIAKAGTIEESHVMMMFQAQFMVRYYHFESTTFDYYDDLTLLELTTVLSLIVETVNRFTETPIANSVNIPYAFDKEYIKNFICECTTYSPECVEKIINAISSSITRPYLWRKPLYHYSEKLFFATAALNTPNICLLYDELLHAAGFSTNERSELLAIKVIDDLKKNEANFHLQVCEIHELLDVGSRFKNNVLFELKDYYLLIECVDYKFPIEIKEINVALSEIALSADICKEKISELSGKLDKPLLPLLISMNNTFSTLEINGVSVIDLQLFKNYTQIGNFRRGMIVFDKGKPKSREYASINYYKNETEFNNNFINFIAAAPPITTVLQRLTWKENDIFPENFSPRIILENIDIIDEDDNIYNQIDILDNVLNKQHFYENDKRTVELYNDSISFTIAAILHLIAFGDYELSQTKIELCRIIKKSKITGFTQLSNGMSNALSRLPLYKIKKDVRFKQTSFGDEIILITEKIFISISSKEIRLYNFEIPIGILNKTEEKKVISLAINVLSTLQPAEFDDSNFDDFMFQFAILQAFKQKYNLYTEFYALCGNMVDTLNHNKKFQRARNFCEEILLISVSEKQHHYGWGILFKCFSYQKNPDEAAVYGALYYTSLSKFTIFTYSMVTNTLFEELKFCRNFHFYERMEKLNDYLAGIHLKKYDQQKFKLSYYLGMIMLAKRKPHILDESLKYLESSLSDIISFGEFGIVPWLNYCYNIKRHKDIGFEEFNIEIEGFIDKLESNISTEKIEQIKFGHFGDKKHNKEKFINNLISALETNSSSDFEFEANHLSISTGLLLKQAIEESDVESLLLTGLVINDNRLTYNNKYHEPYTLAKATLSADAEVKDKLKNYLRYVENNLNLREGQLLIWLFNSSQKIYSLVITCNKEFTIKEIKDWNLKEIQLWLKKKSKFYFDNSKYYDLGEQESSYKETLSTLSFTDLEAEYIFDDLLYTSSIDMSEFPTNLIVNSGDFLGATTPLTNIISLEWYIKNGSPFELNANFKVTAWVPIEDKDPSIVSTYNRLEATLHSLNARIITTRYFKEKIDSELNIFLAHGELDFNSFKGIYTTHDTESAIDEPEELFGAGEVAILFICNSGVVNDSFFGNSINSLCLDILKLGYKAVIAPFWKLDIMIPSYWLDVFLKTFKEGYKLSEAVYLANYSLSKYKDELSYSFYVPEGRLAMHLYGNPNITVGKIKKVKV